MKETEEQLLQKLLKKVNADFDRRIDELTSKGREELKKAIPELFDKKDLVDTITYFSSFKKPELNALTKKEHPLDFIYEQWSNSTDLRFEDAAIAITVIARAEASKQIKNKTEIER